MTGPKSTPDWRDEIRMWHDNWIELAAPEIPHSVRLQRALRAKGIPVFALTNFGVQNFDYATTVYPFLNEFDRHYVSGRMRTVKPHAPIYQMVEDDCGLPPGSLLFADDRIDNIETARSRGWQTHHFNGPQGWADRLVAEGLLRPGGSPLNQAGTAVGRFFTNGQVDNGAEGANGHTDPPHHRVIAILVIQSSTQPDAQKAANLMAEKDNAIESAHVAQPIEMGDQPRGQRHRRQPERSHHQRECNDRERRDREHDKRGGGEGPSGVNGGQQILLWEMVPCPARQ